MRRGGVRMTEGVQLKVVALLPALSCHLPNARVPTKLPKVRIMHLCVLSKALLVRGEAVTPART